MFTAVNIRVGRVPTRRTGERVTLSDTTQPTARTILAGIRRIDIIDQQATPFGSVGHALAHQAALPLAQASAHAFAHPPPGLLAAQGQNVRWSSDALWLGVSAKRAGVC